MKLICFMYFYFYFSISFNCYEIFMKFSFYAKGCSYETISTDCCCIVLSNITTFSKHQNLKKFHFLKTQFCLFENSTFGVLKIFWVWSMWIFEYIAPSTCSDLEHRWLVLPSEKHVEREASNLEHRWLVFPSEEHFERAVSDFRHS